MRKEFDVIVVGAGSGGLTVALFAAETGLKTLLIDREDASIGGDCLNYGCVPSKALIHIARRIASRRDLERLGLNVSGEVDLRSVWQEVRQKQAVIREHENADYLRKKGIDVVLGEARFVSPEAIQVGGKAYTGKKIVLATGSSPRLPDIEGSETVIVHTNETVFSIGELPRHLLIAGSGPVGLELGQAFARLGSKVTIVSPENRILSRESAVLTSVLQKKLEAEGIEFLMPATIKRFVAAQEAEVTSPDGTVRRIAFDAFLAAIGREVRTGHLGLDEAGIAHDGDRILANKYLQTSNPRVFVCGDVAGRHQFSHAAEYHGRVILNNMFSPLRKSLDDSRMSGVTFTDPQLAAFGYNEEQLRARGHRFERIEYDFAGDDRAVTDDYAYGKLILYVTPRSLFGKQRLLGGAMLAPDAGEIVQELILLQQTSGDIGVLFDKLYPYPVGSRVNQLAVVNEKRKALTPGVRRLLRSLFALKN